MKARLYQAFEVDLGPGSAALIRGVKLQGMGSGRS